MRGRQRSHHQRQSSAAAFLIVAPLLAAIAGSYAIIAITLIALLSFWIGSAVRLVISKEESLTNTQTWSLGG